MSGKKERNIVVDRGQPPRNPYGSGNGINPSRDGYGWSFQFGGAGGGEGGRPGTLSGGRRRRLRILDKQRREQEKRRRKEEARRKATAAAESARREAELRSKAQAAEALAKAEDERALAAHRQMLESLPDAHLTRKAELSQQYIQEMEALPISLMSGMQSEASTIALQGEQLLAAIIEEKTRINNLIGTKSERERIKRASAHSFAGDDPLHISSDQYKAILGSRSHNAEQAQEVHKAWAQAYADALDAKLSAHAITLLTEHSASLSRRYAETIWKSQYSETDNERVILNRLAETNRLWTVIAGPRTSPLEVPTTVDKAKAVAEKFFKQQIAKTFGRALSRLVLLYPTELADGERGPSILATAASELGVARDVDLAFIASRNGTVDVTHRMTFEETAGDLTTAWAASDGVSIGAKVPVRAFVHNPSTNTYEFTRDGDARPSIVWTPAITPTNNSTYLPIETPKLNRYPGATLTPVSEALGDYPTYDIEKTEDYILVFPAESGLDPVYVMFKSPRYLPGVVSGVGGTVDPNWRSNATNALGSPVPAVIAEALSGKKYAEFRNLKRAIWRELSKHPELTKDMNSANLSLIAKGMAPYVPRNERKGGRIRFEIHHINPISKGGDVYNIDNLMFNTPANHDKIHRELRQNEAHHE